MSGDSKGESNSILDHSGVLTFLLVLSIDKCDVCSFVIYIDSKLKVLITNTFEHVCGCYGKCFMLLNSSPTVCCV